MTGVTGPVTVAAGESNLSVDAGLVSDSVVAPPVVRVGAPQIEYTGPFTNAPTLPPVPQAPPPLATTGSNANLLATLAMAMMGFGGLLATGARRARFCEY